MITIGLDIGKSKTRGILLSGNKIKAVKEARYDTKILKAPELKEKILGLIEDLTKLSAKRVKAVGIGFPAPVINGKLEQVFRISDLGKINIEKIIQQKYKIPVFIENDANLAALGEYYYGFKKKPKSLFLIILGTGVGGGFIKNGKIENGRWSSGCEFGHTTMDFKDGDKCSCGMRGHVEAYASSLFFKNQKLNSWEIFEKAKKGDRRSLNLWRQYGLNVGIAISNIMNLIEPEVIILAGGLSDAYKFFIKSAIKRAKPNIVLKSVSKKLRVCKSRLGQNAGALGAAVLARNKN